MKGIPGQEFEQGGRMIVARGINRTNESEVIHAVRHILEKLTDLPPALAITLKFKGRRGEKAVAVILIRLQLVVPFERLPHQFLQLGFGVKRVHVTGPALHHEKDAGLGPCREMRRSGQQWIEGGLGPQRFGGGGRILIQQAA